MFNFIFILRENRRLKKKIKELEIKFQKENKELQDKLEKCEKEKNYQAGIAWKQAGLIMSLDVYKKEIETIKRYIGIKE